ncbi:MAG: hypothetical protein ACR2O6_14545 [Ilumatobacteraceae bacterium]
MIRTLFRSVDVPGEGEAHVRVTYLADPATLDDARLTGLVAAAAGPRRPIVIVIPGVNVPPDAYVGLTKALAPIATVVTYSLIGDLGPVGPGITPGIDLAAMAPGVVGTKPSATALAPLLGLVAELDESDLVLAGTLDLANVVVAGHSAGGTVALHNADPEWFPGLVAVVSFAGHTMTATSLGHEAASITAIPSELPTLLVGAGLDGVVAASADRYGVSGDEHNPVGRTFTDGVVADHGDTWYVRLADATHFCICDPADELSGRAFLDPDDAPDQAPIRHYLFDLIGAFVAAYTTAPNNTTTLETLVDHPVVGEWQRR